jgi:hypothetical protein
MCKELRWELLSFFFSLLSLSLILSFNTTAIFRVHLIPYIVSSSTRILFLSEYLRLYRHILTFLRDICDEPERHLIISAGGSCAQALAYI